MKLSIIKKWTLIIILFASPLVVSGGDSHAMQLSSASEIIESNHLSMTSDHTNHHEEKILNCESACQFFDQSCDMGHNYHINLTFIIKGDLIPMGKAELPLYNHLVFNKNQFQPSSFPRPPRH